MRRSRWIFGLILVGLFVAGIAARAAYRKATQVNRPAYTLKTEGTQYNHDGTARRIFVETRYVSSDGNWHDTKQYDSGMVVDTFGIVGKGVFARRNNDAKISFLSSYDAPSAILTAEGFRQHGFVRTESILGHQVFVTNPVNTQEVEFYNDPMLGGATIKMVNKKETSTVVIEPLSITMGEPPASNLPMPPDLEISYDTFNALHKK